MNRQKCPKCETEFVVRNGSAACPNCRETESNPGSQPRGFGSFDVTIDRQVDVEPSDTPADVSHYSISLPSIPARTGEGEGEPEGLRDRKVGDQDHTGTDGESPEFRLIKELDQGAFGKVFRSMQVSLDRQVAVKVLKERFHSQPDIRTDFFKEAQITGRLEHPNVVPVHDIGVAAGGNEAGSPFYVMKEIKGRSWDQLIREKTREENVDILRRVMDAIEFAHSKNILHCDLKPKNVMLGEYGEVLVVDWGHAIDTERPESFRPGGTMAYMSPEMAGFYMDRGSTGIFAHQKWNIGPRSDVYLLGGILFEIITGRYPHVDPEADSKPDPQDDSKRIYPSDQNLKSWALENRICDYSDFAEDELLQIALRALRKTEDEIVTVKQFQAALKTYQTHRRSIEIRSRAFELLEEAKTTASYDTFQKAKLGFEESLDLWNENPLAQEGLRETCLNCAEVALKEQNFDLGLGMLAQAESKIELQVKRKLEVGKRQRDRLKLVNRVLAGTFAIALLAGSLVVGNQHIKLKEEKARVEAGEVKLKEEEARVEAGEIKLKEEEARVESIKLELKDADERKKDAIGEAEAQTAIADAKTAIAKTQTAIADAAKTEASRAKYRTNIIGIEQSISDGNFVAAKEALDNMPNKTLLEWRRLKLLSHPEIAPRSLEGSLRDVKLSGDRSKLVLAFADRIEVRNTVDLNSEIVTLGFTGVECVAVSHSGGQLAIAQQGKISIVPAEPLALSQAEVKLKNVEFDSVFDLEFSRDGKSLVCVGKPKAIRKSAALEQELMVWELNRGEWNVLSPTKFKGRLFTPTVAQFSDDGKRILAFNDSGDREQHQVIVFGRNTISGKTHYELVATAENSIGYSVFGDTQGTSVISSLVEKTTQRVVVWTVDDPTQRLAKSKNIDSKITQLDFRENAVLAITEDRESLFWQLDDSGFSKLNSKPKVFQGHRNALSFAGLLQPASAFVSVSKDDSECLKTDTKTYAKKESKLRLNSSKLEARGAPTVFFESQSTQQAIVGNEQGLVSIHKPAPLGGEPICNWETDAWERHIVTDNRLFAISKRDLLYQYDLMTGELQTVMTQLSQVMDSKKIEPGKSGKISSLEISQDSRFAVLQRDNGKLEFEIWNLERRMRVKTVEFGKFPSLNESTLRNLAISPDGKWIAGGKVTIFIWRNDGTKFGEVGNKSKLESFANSVRFFSGASKLVVSYKDRLKLYKLGTSIEQEGIYQVASLPNSNSFPNLVDATVFNGRNYLLMRRLVEVNGRRDLALELFKLIPGGRARVVQSFPQATNGSFSENKALLVTRDSSKPVMVYDLEKMPEKPREISVSVPRDVAAQSRNSPVSLRKRFSRIHMDENGDLVLNWQIAGKHNTVSVKANGQVGDLVVTATPRLQAVATGSNSAVTLSNSKLRLWNISDGAERFVSPQRTFKGNYRLAEISPDMTKAFVVDSRSEKAVVMQLNAGSERVEIDRVDAADINSATWSSDNETLAIGFKNGQVRVNDVVVFSPDPEDADSSNQSVKQLNFSDDGQSLVVVQSASDDESAQGNIANAFTLRKAKQGSWKVSAQFNHPDQDPIQCADISADGSRVVTGSSRGRITIWDSTAAENNELEEDEVSKEPSEQPTEKDFRDRELLIIGRLVSAVQAVGFLQEESAVIALEAQSSTAIVFPFAK